MYSDVVGGPADEEDEDGGLGDDVCGTERPGRDSRIRIGRWKASVSAKQRNRKKRYCRIIGWVVRKAEKGILVVSEDVESRREEVPEAVLFEFRLDEGVVERGSAEESVFEDGAVAFSMRAHVR